MARAAKNVSTKARASGKARDRASSKTRNASTKTATAQKRSVSRAQTRKRAPASQGWSSAIETLFTSVQGREILADVLEAAAAALRKHGLVTQQAAETGMQQATEATEAAAHVGGAVASGTMGLAQTAADVLADVVTAALTGTDKRDERRRRGGARKRKTTTA